MTFRPHLFVTCRPGRGKSTFLRLQRMTLGEFRSAARELTDTINGVADRVDEAIAAGRPGAADRAREIQPIGEPVFTTLRRERS